VLGLLRHANPAVRADGCRLARAGSEVVPLLLELLSDLHPEVAAAASCALGRLGRTEARPGLIRLLANAPSAEIIEAFVGIADEDGVVVLGRLAANRPDLAEAVMAALDEIDLPRAAIVAHGLRRKLATLERSSASVPA
jgi:HEAT repeat protein